MMDYRIIEDRDVLEKTAMTGKTNAPEQPGGKSYLWLLFLGIIITITIATWTKKDKPDLDVPDDRELFEKLSDHSKESFEEKYGKPDEDDRECETLTL